MALNYQLAQDWHPTTANPTSAVTVGKDIKNDIFSLGLNNFGRSYMPELGKKAM
jgi:hypothetical protein